MVWCASSVKISPGERGFEKIYILEGIAHFASPWGPWPGTPQRHTPCSRCCSFSSTKPSSWLGVGNCFSALHIMSITIELRHELGERVIVGAASGRQGQSGTSQIQFTSTFNSGIKESCINLCLVTPILQKEKLRYVEGLSSR